MGDPHCREYSVSTAATPFTYSANGRHKSIQIFRQRLDTNLTRSLQLAYRSHQNHGTSVRLAAELRLQIMSCSH